jgi:hypothetical protein
VHFPLAFLTLANVLNLLYGIVLYFPSNPFSTLSILGYASNVLGIITSIPAVLTGGAELYAMIQSNGLYQTSEKGEKVLVPKVKIALMHVSVLPVFWVVRFVIDTYRLVSMTSSSQARCLIGCKSGMSLIFDQPATRSP